MKDNSNTYLKCHTLRLVILVFINGFFCKTYSQQDAYSALYEYKDSYEVRIESKLMIKGNESVFKILDNRDAGIKYDENGNFKYIVTNDDISTIMFSDSINSYVRIPFPDLRGGSAYKFPLSEINWEITGSIKKIKNYPCQEAILDLHGRKYVAWFTMELPISKAPFNLNGLPGLIVEFKETTGNFSIQLISLKKEEDEEFFISVKDFFKFNNLMDYPSYEKFMKKYIVELKIKKANSIAEMLKNSGGTVEFSFGRGQYHWVGKIIDIPSGTMEELEKIYFYD